MPQTSKYAFFLDIKSLRQDQYNSYVNEKIDEAILKDPTVVDQVLMASVIA